MFQDKNKALKTAISAWYNAAWLFRWALYLTICVTWYDKPRSIYWTIIIIDAIFVAWAVLACKSFFKPCGILIIVSESLTFLRHGVQVVNLHDMAGTGGMTQGAVDFITHIAFWSYIFSTLIEFALLFTPLFAKGAGKFKAAQENAASEDVKLDLQSENELGTKIGNYKEMKSGRKS
jgi:hypothetical protein